MGAAVASQPGIAWAEDTTTESLSDATGAQQSTQPQEPQSPADPPAGDLASPAEQSPVSGTTTTIDNGSAPTVVVSSSGGALTSGDPEPEEVEPPTTDVPTAPTPTAPPPPAPVSQPDNGPVTPSGAAPTTSPEPAKGGSTAPLTPADPPGSSQRTAGGVDEDGTVSGTRTAAMNVDLPAAETFSMAAAEVADVAPVTTPPPSLVETLLSVPAALIAGAVNVVLNFIEPFVAPGGPFENAMLFGLLAWTRRQFNQTLVNRSPEIGQDISLTVDEDSAATVIGSLPATDEDGDTIVYSVHPDHGPSNGTVTIVGNQVSYTPDAGYAGADGFALTGTDAAAGFHVHAAGESHADTLTVTVTIRPDGENDAPVANADSGTVAEGGTVIVDVIDNDTDTDGTIDPATVVIGTTVNGTATANPDGTVSFTHNGTETTTASFTYTVKDNNGATSNSTTVTLAVTPVDDAPTAVNDSATPPRAPRSPSTC
ncbi:hypothetical protein SAMN04489835_5111 [Mycolicibacterium rutilum]|uniref:VCBS repeat-containing protein n=1 Tax=Mycolicibacterium rutilum TaxID=370526 RepID=A0A1H6LLY3_MYCRU|nr:hypothetical protein SAMN04489835_5111 [Mycolicibacterium rutilum]